MLTKVRELIKSEEFKKTILENNIDFSKVHKNLDCIEDYIMTGKFYRYMKTNKVKFLIEKVLEVHENQNPYQYSSSEKYDMAHDENSGKLTKNKTHLNCHKEIGDREAINIEKIFELVHRRFKYPNETLKKTLGFFHSQTPYKDHEDYAQDFLMYILQQQNEVLYRTLSDDELFKLTNNAIRNYLINTTKSFAKTMLPEPKLGLSLDEWELFYLIGTNKKLNKQHIGGKYSEVSKKTVELSNSICEKLSMKIDCFSIENIRTLFKQKFDELEVGVYATKER